MASALLPHWAHLWGFVYKRELEALHECGRTYRINSQASAEGRLEVDLTWICRGETYPLTIRYPDSFPRAKPDIRIVDSNKRPERHVSPIDGSICLLGRNTGQWDQTWTAIDLLNNQFEEAIYGTDDEDPQGEPAEFWWNFRAVPGSFCLVDSGWELGDAQSGLASLAFSAQVKQGSEPVIRAAITELRDAERQVIGRLPVVAPDDLKLKVAIPWIRVPSTIYPSDDGIALNAALGRFRNINAGQPLPLGNGHSARLCAIVHDIEIGFRQTGLGWLFPFIYDRVPNVRYDGQRRSVYNLATLRAGRSDLVTRSPAAKPIEHKTVVICGIGAIGSFVALDLARNGCSKIVLVDGDVLEPGNSVRWPGGRPHWGLDKVDALRQQIMRDYPLVNVVGVKHVIGNVSGGDAVLDERHLSGCDLIANFTVSNSPSCWLSDRARFHGVTLVSAGATPTLQGGYVGAFAVAGACQLCLERAWAGGAIQEPLGWAQEAKADLQPPGCSERTFTGASYDLQEISLQASRVIVARLSRPWPISEVQTVCFQDPGPGNHPVWRNDTLLPDPLCDCVNGRGF